MDTSSSAALEGDAEEHAYTRSYALRQHDDVSDALDVYWKTMLRSAIFPKTVETEGKTESVVQKDDVGTCGSNPAPARPGLTWSAALHPPAAPARRTRDPCAPVPSAALWYSR